MDGLIVREILLMQESVMEGPGPIHAMAPSEKVDEDRAKVNAVMDNVPGTMHRVIWNDVVIGDAAKYARMGALFIGSAEAACVRRNQ